MAQQINISNQLMLQSQQIPSSDAEETTPIHDCSEEVDYDKVCGLSAEQVSNIANDLLHPTDNMPGNTFQNAPQ